MHLDDGLVNRDKRSSELFWLRGEGMLDSANLSPLNHFADEGMEDPCAVL